jgi:superoxide reductase
MPVFICSVCGHLEFPSQPVKCPACGSPAEKFSRNDRVFEESAEKSKEAAAKHIPSVIVNRECNLIPEQSCVDAIVRIGAALHPMDDAHYIRFIDCYIDNTWIARTTLSPGVYPAGVFHLKRSGSNLTIVENCTIHGYWKTDIKL